VKLIPPAGTELAPADKAELEEEAALHTRNLLAMID